MDFKNFKYTKKKDGETKGYLVMVFEDSDQYLEGLDLGKLEEPEIREAFKISIEREALEKQWAVEAEKQGMSYEDYVGEPVRQEKLQQLKEAMQPFVKQAYRKYLKSNIEDPTPVDNPLEESE
jgi:hypothetical protein